ncbi:MAG TPA: hypothetical protein VJ735_05965 [Actinomycetes bacterium]|nr:hypothetical protein [Actinomycetes bacterium]
MLPDGEADRIRHQVLPHIPDPNLRHWIAELLRDRDERIAVLLQLSRQLYHLRRRLKQAGGYLQGLIDGALQTARSPWPEKVVFCSECGAPADRMGAALRPEGGHEMVNYHLDGKRCVVRGSDAG